MNGLTVSACGLCSLLLLLVISHEDSVLMQISLFCRQDSLDGDVLGHFVSSKRSSHKSRPIKTVPGEGPPVASAWEKMDKLPMSEPSLDTKRMGEKVRPKSGLIVRGMMAGPVASSPQVGLMLELWAWWAMSYELWAMRYDAWAWCYECGNWG